MKVLMLWEYYPEYLSYFYNKYPSVVGLPFEEHRTKIFDDRFGWPADLSRYMNKQGIQTEFIIANAEYLQKKWAQKNNFTSYSKKGWEKEIALEQIRTFKPDILWITSIFDYYGNFVKRASAYCKKVITWVSCATPTNLDVSGFATLITSHPDMLKDKQHLFDEVIVTTPGFDHEILSEIGNVEKKYDVTFIGGITPHHSKRAEILAHLIKNGIDVNVFGHINELPGLGTWDWFKRAGKFLLSQKDIIGGLGTVKHTYKTGYRRNVEIIKSVQDGPVFGLDMYRTLAASRITLNVHIDAAGSYAGNVRMFESTGVGTCLLTEHSENISELFEPAKEILTYRSESELLDTIKEMLDQNEKIKKIAMAGQKKTLQNYTPEKTFNDIRHAFEI